MATIILSSYVMRYPVGGVLANNLQFLTGFARLGHDVYVVEKAGYDDSCFDPVRRINSDDCSCGLGRIDELLTRVGLGGRWCYVDAEGTYSGMDRSSVEAIFGRCDLFIDRGLHRTWDAEAAGARRRVLLDPDPGFRQVRLQHDLDRGHPVPAYDAYFTYGHNIGTPASPAPDAGVHWQHVFHPVDTSLYRALPLAGPTAPCTTVMNWHALQELEFNGRVYGMKDRQFPYFERLPSLVDGPLEIAVEGRDIPTERLRELGWNVVSALDATASYDDYLSYIARSSAEFSVVKDVYHGLRTGWFSDRSAIYLAHGRPVVVQDNGIAAHLPVGEGLFEVANVDEAAAALRDIAADPVRHSAAARRIAEQHLDTSIVLGRFLADLDIEPVAGPSSLEERST